MAVVTVDPAALRREASGRGCRIVVPFAHPCRERQGPRPKGSLAVVTFAAERVRVQVG